MYHNKHQISFILAVCYDMHFLWYMACVYVYVCVYMYVCVYVIISQWDLTFKRMLPTRKWIGKLISTRRWFCKLETRWEGIRVSKVVEEFKNAGPAIRRTLSLPMRSQVLVPISSVLVPVTATLVTRDNHLLREAVLLLQIACYRFHHVLANSVGSVVW